MKVLFVYSLADIQSPDKPLSQPEEMNFGLSYISAVLKQHGHATKLVVLSRQLGKKNAERLDEAITVFEPKIICWSAVSTEYPFMAEQAAYVKAKYPDIFLIIGGPHVSLNPDGVLNGAFDALCIGEGEYPIWELVEQLAQGKTPIGIANLWIKHGSGIAKNPTRPFLANLDDLPFPDRELWQDWIADSPAARYSVLLGRGCPFNCTYCSNHALRKLASGRYVRWRSPDNIVAEIKEIALKFPKKKEIYLEVETFGVDKVWARELCCKLKNLNSSLDQPLSFGVNIRVTPGADFNDLFAACREANFRFINVGLESGSNRVRQEVLKRIYDNQDIVRTVVAARQHGLQVALFNMIGLPTETLADFRETIKVNRECQPDWHLTSIFYPYPGTDLYQLCRDLGLLKDQPKKFLTERVQSVLDLPGFSKKQIQKNFIWFDWRVYKGFKPWHKLLITVAATKLRTRPRLHYYFRRLTKSKLLKQLKSRIKV
jgi:anaerobic magnesium-protoporphyrin IX monomethyl ester cyclase